MIGVGAFGSVLAGLYVDRTKQFEEVVKVCWALAVLFGIGFTQVRKTHEPVREKTNNLGFRPGLTQTGLYSHRRWLEA